MEYNKNRECGQTKSAGRIQLPALQILVRRLLAEAFANDPTEKRAHIRTEHNKDEPPEQRVQVLPELLEFERVALLVLEIERARDWFNVQRDFMLLPNELIFHLVDLSVLARKSERVLGTLQICQALL